MFTGVAVWITEFSEFGRWKYESRTDVIIAWRKKRWEKRIAKFYTTKTEYSVYGENLFILNTGAK